MGNNPSYFSRTGERKDSVEDVSDDDLQDFPVEGVSWEDAQEFIKRLNAREKDRRPGWVYRMPLRREWVYACCGGASSKEDCSYHFYLDRPSNDLSSEQANFNGYKPHGNARKGKWLGRPTRVGSYPANRLGLYDMHGNVHEWCENSKRFGAYKVLGGSWYSSGSNCTVAHGSATRDTDGKPSIGFRLALVPSGE
jgi:formylglycine-generating enzyme required for sulfatase activity